MKFLTKVEPSYPAATLRRGISSAFFWMRMVTAPLNEVAALMPLFYHFDTNSLYSFDNLSTICRNTRFGDVELLFKERKKTEKSNP